MSARNRVALLDERRRSGRRRAIEGADHRALDADERVVAGRARRLRVGVGRRSRQRRRLRPVRCAAHGDAHPVLLDRDLPHARLLDDAHELADALGALLVDALRRE